MKPTRVAMTGLGIAGLLAAALLIPLPHYVDMPVYVQPVGMASVYVKEPGIVQEIHARPATYIQRSTPILRLANDQLENQVLEAEAEVAKCNAQLHAVEELKVEGDQRASFAYETAVIQLRNSQDHLKQQKMRLTSLQVTAPSDGWIVPVPDQKEPGSDADRLPKLVGNPLSPQNLSATLPEQTLVCHIAPDLEKWEAMILVDQQDIEFVQAGQSIKLWLAMIPNQVFPTEVDEIAIEPMKFIPPQMASQNAGPIEATTSLGGKFKPESAKYLVKAQVVDRSGNFTKDSTGVARIHVGYETVGRRVWRFLAHTFSFNL